MSVTAAPKLSIAPPSFAEFPSNVEPVSVIAPPARAIPPPADAAELSTNDHVVEIDEIRLALGSLLKIAHRRPVPAIVSR